MEPNSEERPPDATVFRAHAAYLVYTVAAGIVALLQAWTLLGAFDWMTVVALVIALGILLWSVQRLATRVEVGPKALIVRVPLQRPLQIGFRQLAGLHEEGRLLKAVVVLYRPLRPDGLVDPDDLRGLTLPGLKDQAALLAQLDILAPGLQDQP